MTTLSQAEKQFLVDHSRTDPAWFWDAVLGCSSVYDKQLQMARAVRDHIRVAIHQSISLADCQSLPVPLAPTTATRLWSRTALAISNCLS